MTAQSWSSELLLVTESKQTDLIQTAIGQANPHVSPTEWEKEKCRFTVHVDY
jgi:hypothetical protein